MKRPLWLAMCDLWIAERRGDTGLTVPFLVGAFQIIDAGGDHTTADKAALAKLLYTMQTECPKGHCVRIDMCGVRGKPVVKVAPMTDVHVKSELISAKKGKSQLYLAQKYKHDGTIESAVEALWDVVGNCLTSGEFSFVREKYRKFDVDELAFIKRAKNAA